LENFKVRRFAVFITNFSSEGQRPGADILQSSQRLNAGVGIWTKRILINLLCESWRGF
jgi:hypothetical protein